MKSHEMSWHTLDAHEVAQHLETRIPDGLSSEAAVERLSQYGPNELEESGLKSPWLILWEQFTAAMMVILIIAAGISALVGEGKDSVAILVIVLLNALLGFRQEYKAEKAMAALKALAVPSVRVRREGVVLEIPASELVPGDVMILETGNLVPADGRINENHNLRLQEAALTGESVPVEKEARSLASRDLSLADRRNMVYTGTVVTFGRGEAIVTETGMDTEIGQIASAIQTVKREPTPLQRRLAQLGHGLAAAALALVSIIFILGLLRGEDLKEMFLISVSLAVAAVPEGLPAVVTISLALGSQRMLRRRALIRKLPAVETLGSVTVICSDKTGTLTKNRMAAAIIDLLDHKIELDRPQSLSNSAMDAHDRRLSWFSKHPPSATLALICGALCNDAVLRSDSSSANGDSKPVGDPTEVALVAAAAREGFLKPQLEAVLPRIAEVPFDSGRKRMSTLHEVQAGENHLLKNLSTLNNDLLDFTQHSHILFTKGAVDTVVGVSGGVLTGMRLEPLNGVWRDVIVSANDRLAANGMRVLGLAFRPLQILQSDEYPETLEHDLIFLGMVGMIDPPREEAEAAVAKCKEAGIRPVMITGDHPLTARYIARELGILTGDNFLTGVDLGRISLEDLEKKVEDISLYARVSPEHKLNIVQALQNRNHIVAMTGDGVNDAPALRKADIGVAMGITGTDVTKEVADMVLLDDNFATIVAAVEEGRIIYDNIRKFIKYLLSTNSGELLVMLIAPLLGMPLPLLPLQILWINLVTDGLPALALSVEPGEPDVMRRPPHPPTENIFGRGMGRHILGVGVLMGSIPLMAGYWYWRNGDTTWQTMIFMILTFSQLTQAMAIRSGQFSLFSIGIFSNRAMLGAIVLTFLLQMIVVYVPFFGELFKTLPLSAQDLVICIALSTIVFWVVEIDKWLRRRKVHK